MTDNPFPTSPLRGPTVPTGTAGSHPRSGEPTSHWEIVRAAIGRGLSEYAAAYFIPANFILGTDFEAQRRLANTWGEIAAPHITACIREDLRRTGQQVDWKSMCVRLFRLDPDCRLLNTTEVEALRAAQADAEAIERDAVEERTQDAASGLEGR